MSPIGWADEVLDARLSYRRFDAVVVRARREVLRSAPVAWADVPIRTVSAEGVWTGRWGEFYRPSGPIVLYQLAFETMDDPENYYRQIKAVLIHEYEHSTGETHGEAMYAHVAAR